jgi:sugar phosphate isomerase/epimerase
LTFNFLAGVAVKPTSIASSVSSASKSSLPGHVLTPVEVAGQPAATSHPPTGETPAVDRSMRFHPLLERLSVNQLTTLKWPLDVDLDEYVQSGLPAIGLNWRKLSEFGVQRGVRRVQQSGLSISSLGWISGFTGQNGYSLAQSLHEGKRLIRLAGQLRASCVTVISGPQGGHIRSHARRLIREGLMELADLAAIYEVDLALQPMHPVFSPGWSFLHTLEQGLEIIDQVAHPAAKLAFGAYHLCHDGNALDLIPDVVDRVALVTLSDRNGPPRGENDQYLPGDGELPLADIVSELELAGYGGWYEIEVWSRQLWRRDHHDLLDHCYLAAQDLATCVPCHAPV